MWGRFCPAANRTINGFNGSRRPVFGRGGRPGLPLSSALSTFSTLSKIRVCKPFVLRWQQPRHATHAVSFSSGRGSPDLAPPRASEAPRNDHDHDEVYVDDGGDDMADDLYFTDDEEWSDDDRGPLAEEEAGDSGEVISWEQGREERLLTSSDDDVSDDDDLAMDEEAMARAQGVVVVPATGGAAGEEEEYVEIVDTTESKKMSKAKRLAEMFDVEEVADEDKVLSHIGTALVDHDIHPDEQQIWAKEAMPFKQLWTRKALIHTTHDFEGPAMRVIKATAFKSNLVLEVRDIRCPDSSHHPSFSQLCMHKKHIIVYTHADCVDEKTANLVRAWTKRKWASATVLMVDSRESRSYPEPFEELYAVIVQTLDRVGGVRFALTCGMANVGKSAVIVALLRRFGNEPQKRVHFGRGGRLKKGLPGIRDVPGHTKDVTQWLLRDKPRAYVMDVPGMSPPRFYIEESHDRWWALFAAGIIIPNPEFRDEAHIKVCRYILFCCNRAKQFGYVVQLDLLGPTQDIAVILGKVTPEEFVSLFRSGSLGPVVLDDVYKTQMR